MRRVSPRHLAIGAVTTASAFAFLHPVSPGAASIALGIIVLVFVLLIARKPQISLTR